REKRGLCYSIYAFHWSFADTGLFGVHVATGPDDVDELMTVVTDELERAVEDIDDNELKRARAQLRAGLLMTLESPAARAGQIARQILLFGRIIPPDELIEKIAGITAADVRDLTGRLLSGSAPTLSMVGPASGKMYRDRIAERFGAKIDA
ncbi:MAG TPA: insulinase family protein, partial [Bauldia sp.]|nr:insulinase family protein [Bauldia sp.]